MGELAWLVTQTKGMSEYVRRCQIKMMCSQAKDTICTTTKKRKEKKNVASVFCYDAFFPAISFHYNSMKMLPVVKKMSVVLENPPLPQNDGENRPDNCQKKKKKKRKKKKKIRLADLHCKT